MELDDNNEFQMLMQDKYHKQLKKCFNDLILELKTARDAAAVYALEQQRESVETIERLLNNHKPDVSSHNKEIISVLTEIKSDMRTGWEDVKRILSAKKEWKFDIDADPRSGVITSIRAIQIK